MKAELLFYEKRMEVAIIWYDKISKNLFKPGDNIFGYDLEFHWEDFDLHHPSLKEVGTKRKDIRKIFGWTVSFPIVCRYTEFNSDITLKLPVKSRKDIDHIERILSETQEEWNAVNLIHDSIDAVGSQGIVHSVSFMEIDDDAKAIFSVDRGSACDDFFKSFFKNLIMLIL
ncbi:MAG: hypothetical protein SH808_01985 [Saprospiraceae bacterium]|nr:hypothetical protein [Saprospiraceae bacterium]